MDDPKITADNFAKAMNEKGLNLDFSIHSLEFEIDNILEPFNYSQKINYFLDVINPKRINRKIQLEKNLTAYIGETLIRNFEGKWLGNYYGPNNKVDMNYYTSSISLLKGYLLNPNHFICYYLTNGKKETGSFYDFLHKKYKYYKNGEGIGQKGLLNQIKENDFNF